MLTLGLRIGPGAAGFPPGQGGGGAPAPASVLAAVNADGWSARYGDPVALAGASDLGSASVTRNGFDASGAPIQFTETLPLTKRLRQPYPAQASLTADQVVLSDFIYAGEVVAGTTNDSTLGYPVPVCLWLTPDLGWTTDAGAVTLRLAVAHAHARQGRPVAAVKFIVSDGVNAPVEQTVSAMSVVSYAKTGLSAPHFAASLDLAGLNAGGVTVDAIIYPWIGSAYQLSVDAPAYPSFTTTTIRLLNKPASYGVAYAHVNGTGGGTPTVSTDPAVAAANPYSTVAAASSALVSFNTATFGRASMSGGIIRLTPAVHVLTNWSSRASGEFGVIVEAADPASKATTVLTDAGVATNNVTPAITRFRNLVMRRSANGSFIFLDNNGGLSRQCVLENITFDANGTSVYNAWIYRLGRLILIDCDGGNVGQTSSQGTVTHGVTLLGTNSAPGSQWVNHTLCCRMTGASPQATAACFIGWNYLSNNSTSSPAVSGTGALDFRGAAVVGNVVEGRAGGPSALVTLFADNVTGGALNMVMMDNTVVGERLNFLYSDNSGATALKQGVFRNNVVELYNCKTDPFANNGATGNWPAAFQVGFANNAALRGASDSSQAPGTGQWIGEVRARGSLAGSSASPLNAAFANPQYYQGTPAAGGGDYTPGPATALPRLTAADTTQAFDLLGRAVPADGTALAGAVQQGV